jgi:hypothetical protein
MRAKCHKTHAYDPRLSVDFPSTPRTTTSQGSWQRKHIFMMSLITCLGNTMSKLTPIEYTIQSAVKAQWHEEFSTSLLSCRRSARLRGLWVSKDTELHLWNFIPQPKVRKMLRETSKFRIKISKSFSISAGMHLPISRKTKRVTSTQKQRLRWIDSLCIPQIMLFKIATQGHPQSRAFSSFWGQAKDLVETLWLLARASLLTKLP